MDGLLGGREGKRRRLSSSAPWRVADVDAWNKNKSYAGWITGERHGSVAAPWQLLAHRYLATADGTSCFHMLFMWSVVTGYTGGMNPSEI
uniref:Uncharacterized protein n=3 Tax=Oryza TaxID=4527 RepID=Q9AUK7_ORYSJ|nr:hypothetical protein [Oryza sativa Japonica Group]